MRIEVLDGLGAIGATYHSCPYWRREVGRPTFHLSLWWVKLIISLPWKHVTPLGYGTATSDYGIFWWPSVRMKPLLKWQTLREK